MKKRDLIVLMLVIVFLTFVFTVGGKSKNYSSENNMAIPEEYTNKENNEAVVVEEYIRSNIKTIAINQPVLGGSWYVVSLTIDPSMDSGTVVYEDGHIQSTASFSYEYENNSVARISKFEIIE